MKSQDMDNAASFQVVDVDQYLGMVGEFGKMQIILQVMYSLMIFPTTYQVLLLVFAANNPPWKCTGLNAECNNTRDVFYETQIGYKKRCMLQNSSSWEFTQPKKFSIVTEWDLVCEREHLIHIANSAIFIGWLISAPTVGFISDRFGRKKVLFPSLFLTILCGFVSAFTNDIWQFFVLRCIIGIFQGGAVTLIFTSVAEMVGPKYRALSGTLIWFSYSVALCLTDLQAWLVSDWRLLNIIVTAPYIVFIIFWKFVPESTRWLRVNDRREEAEKFLKKVAKVNGKPIPSTTLSREVKVVDHSTMIDLFRPWSRCKSSLTQFFIWFTNSLVYFGVSIASGDLGGNLYRDFVLTSLVDIPAAAGAILLANRYGRKLSTLVSMFISGLACIAVAIVPSGTSIQGYIWLRVVFGMIGKLCITLSFDVIFVWSAEIYPTIVRVQGLGLMAIASAVGATASPWVAKWLGNFHSAVPFAVMGGCAVVAAFLCNLLNETKGNPTVEVFENGHQMKENLVTEFGGKNNDKIENTAL